MRKHLCILAVLICLFSLTARAIVDDRGISPAAAKPMIFINTNLGSGSSYWVEINGTYNAFAELAKESGYNIDQGYLTTIKDPRLANVDVLVLSMPGLKLLDDDKTTLRKFISDGGSLFLLVDLPSYYPWVDLTNLESFTKDYGISFGDSSEFEDIADVVKGTALSKPEKAEKLSSPYGRVHLLIDSARAEAAAKFDNGKILVAYSTYTKLLGKGKLVVIGDSRMLANEPFVRELNRQDNKAFVKNILLYFAAGYDLSVAKVKVKPGNVAAGEKVKVQAVIRNVGDSESEATKLSFLLSSASDSDLSPPADPIVLKTVSIKPLASGKKIKVKMKLLIPDSVEPSEYYLIALVDPDGTSSDSNTNNNKKASKKIIVQ